MDHIKSIWDYVSNNNLLSQVVAVVFLGLIVLLFREPFQYYNDKRKIYNWLKESEATSNNDWRTSDAIHRGTGISPERVRWLAEKHSKIKRNSGNNDLWRTSGSK